MARIKELEDILVLVDRMPRRDQLECVQYLLWQVEHWEDKESFDDPDNPLAYLAELVRRSEERRKRPR